MQSSDPKSKKLSFINEFLKNYMVFSSYADVTASNSYIQMRTQAKISLKLWNANEERRYSKILIRVSFRTVDYDGVAVAYGGEAKQFYSLKFSEFVRNKIKQNDLGFGVP
ncbi:serine/threonine-protein phosphatase 2A 55 kDaregulatory subunit B delta isoform [Striga asiatica]|uniref:Serine/threonine-protein phosphatase 2A 55 kDaregulatory subunit B delta isoform n=1 Tax=Striga asiatica TaxID=4170 RepID=A0A5A7QMZ9_STRAF|nr:serine/threonine-protein phosphatase 2A 55 kDaregulatory subunit B delta isoform [Striga asiatica]